MSADTASDTVSHRKGQAAIEYLMNYAWAIALIIIVGIAIFALDIGGLRTSLNARGSTATQAGEEVAVQDHVYAADGTIDLTVVNRGADRLNVTSIGLVSVDGDTANGGDINDTHNVLSVGETSNVFSLTGITKTVGDPVDYTINISYTNQETDISHTRERDLTATVSQ